MARVALITGSTDGIGRATARALAAAGMKVIVHGRSKVKVDAAIVALQNELPGAELDGVAFDLGTLASVRRGADALRAKFPAIHVLVNNAGIFASERSVTDDGIELTLAVNYVAPFLLTELLADRLERVIDVSSIAHGRGKVPEDFTFATGFTGYGAYASSKLAQVMHALSLADRGRVAYALHPGVISTKLLRQGFGPIQGGSVEQGAKTSVRLAGEDTVTAASGAYFQDGVETQPAVAARDKAARDRLWDATARIAGL